MYLILQGEVVALRCVFRAHFLNKLWLAKMLPSVFSAGILKPRVVIMMRVASKKRSQDSAKALPVRHLATSAE